MIHTFVICAYKESEYLEACISSLMAQSVRSDIIMVTSTDNAMIRNMADKYHISLYVNHGESGITQDWNFGLAQVKTKYATIAHQDDVYEPTYTEALVGRMERSGRPLIGFSDYFELRNGQRVSDNSLLKIKQVMLFPLRIKALQKNRFIRRRSLSMGDAICCPSVCYCLENLRQPVFEHHYRSCEDWEAWEKISRERGAFVYVPQLLMGHRIHEQSTTTEILKDHARVAENYEMFCKFWPKAIARRINAFYTKSESSNNL